MTDTLGALRISPWASRTDLKYAGRAAIDSYELLKALVTERIGAEAAGIFAEPRRVEGGIAWFDPRGESGGVPLASLSAEDRAQVEATLRLVVGEIESAFGDPRVGDVAFFALNFDSEEFVWAVGARPILVGWGGLPTSAFTSAELVSHHNRTIGRYLTNTDPPVLRTTIVENAAPMRFAGIPGSWIAAGIALLALLILLLPGVLSRHTPVQLGATCADETGTLEAQIAARERALASDVCRPGAATVPQVAPPPADRRGGRVDPDGQSGANPSPEYGLPVQPERSPVPRESLAPGSTQPENLAQLLASATVIVVTEKGIGTGFLVGPQHVLTNRHVVEGGREIVVGNLKLPNVMPVERVAMSTGSEFGAPDFALLKLKLGRSPFFLSMAGDPPEQLQNVIAVGYPGIVIRSDGLAGMDPDFLRLRRGDQSAIPEVAMTNGTVTVVQRRQSENPLIIHRASISSGNSGGPLVDECGRAVGVNTFVLAAGGANDRLNYSLASRAAIEFLRTNGVQPNVVAGGCLAGSSRGQEPSGPAPPNTAPPAPIGGTK